MRFASLLLVALLFAPAALAQDAADEPRERTRVLRAWSEPVKLEDGARTVYNHEVIFDYETGVTRQVVRDEDGALVADFPIQQIRPTPEEFGEAMEILMAQPSFQSLRATRPFEADGGFILAQEEGQACGPGSRCLQIDLLDATDRTQRVRYVVVDLVSRTVAYPNFNPARDGNRF
ncbi:MAG: hypothetical protein AAF624_07285 [Bacteroidota bacterium]